MKTSALAWVWGMAFTVVLAGCGGKDEDKPASTGGTSAGGAGTGGAEAGTAGSAGEGTAGAAGAGTGGTSVTPAGPHPWDWNGVIGTGQSLAVGTTPVVTTTQPFNNLKLSTGDLDWPIDPTDATLEMVPLIEPIGRRAPGYPSAWPENIYGETPHSAMGNEVTALAMAGGAADYVSVHGEFGESGQCISYLAKGAAEVVDAQGHPNGRAFAASLIETQAIARLARAAGKTYGVGAITLVHGECDSGNSNYESDIVQLLTDYDTDLKAITGQTDSVQMLLSQQNSIGGASTLTQWQLGVTHASITCVGPTYHYPYQGDGVHLVSEGYRMLGEKFGEVYFERVVLGNDWRPLHPESVERTSARVITVSFHVPVPPLVWDDVLPAPHPGTPEWTAGRGFEVSSGSTKLAIVSAEIVDSTVAITVAEDLPASGVNVSYALFSEDADEDGTAELREGGTKRWGLLRDSDATVGETTGAALPNFALAFRLEVP